MTTTGPTTRRSFSMSCSTTRACRGGWRPRWNACGRPRRTELAEVTNSRKTARPSDRSAGVQRKPDEPDIRVDCSMHTEQGEIHRCPIWGAVVVHRFGHCPLRSTAHGPQPPEGATVMEDRSVCSADSDHELN